MDEAGRPPADQCPHCGSSQHVHIVRSYGNLARIVGNIALVPLKAVLLIVTFGVIHVPAPPFNLVRVCKRCGLYFTPGKTWKDTTKCPVCRYSLLGNISGVCPECGWKLPPWYVGRADEEFERQKGQTSGS